MIVDLTFVASDGLEDVLVAFHNVAPDEYSLAEESVRRFGGGAYYLERCEFLLGSPVTYKFQPRRRCDVAWGEAIIGFDFVDMGPVLGVEAASARYKLEYHIIALGLDSGSGT